jgi:uncharacterized membrane protein
MKVIKLEERENESLLWEMVIVLAFILDVILLFVIVYIAAFAPDSMIMGLAAGLNMTLLAIIFIGIKKGVMPQERIYVKI